MCHNVGAPGVEKFKGMIGQIGFKIVQQYILVSQGLARIRAGQACPGIKALLKVDSINIRVLG